MAFSFRMGVEKLAQTVTNVAAVSVIAERFEEGSAIGKAAEHAKGIALANPICAGVRRRHEKNIDLSDLGRDFFAGFDFAERGEEGFEVLFGELVVNKTGHGKASKKAVESVKVLYGIMRVRQTIE